MENAYSLQYLDIGLNEIGQEGAIAIGTAIYQKPEIKVLKIGRNNIKNAGLNGLLNALCHESNKNSTLQYLDLSNNNYDNSCAENIYFFLHNCPNLLEIDISENGIRFNYIFKTVCKVINENETMHDVLGFGETYI
jgi:Ran GTPase-activating protein (RanGAP) involved in mRNA processing and transport